MNMHALDIFAYFAQYRGCDYTAFTEILLLRAGWNLRSLAGPVSCFKSLSYLYAVLL